MEHREWREQVAWGLLRLSPSKRSGSTSKRKRGGGDGEESDAAEEVDLNHHKLYPHPTRSNAHCAEGCGKRSDKLCVTCGKAICHPVTGRECQVRHMLRNINTNEWARAQNALVGPE